MVHKIPGSKANNKTFFFFNATSFLQMENGDFELKVTFSLEDQLIISSELGF